MPLSQLRLVHWFMLERLAPLLALPVLIACGSSDDAASDGGKFGGHQLASLSDPCEGMAGLTGQSILDQRVDAQDSTLAYITASGQPVDPTDVSVTIAWPDAPAATCYPPFESQSHQVADRRVAIAGLTLGFSTADGKFSETLPAKAWLMVNSGAVGPMQILAATTRPELKGTWQPFPEYATFSTMLFALVPSLQSGVVAASAQPVDELQAGVIQGSLAVATFPQAP